jgi:tetratricopeptide (TPR) repeat protein
MAERTGRYDPDKIASLEDELEMQLASLKDLDAELAAGDLDQSDYETLKDDYTVRVADTMRRIDQQTDLVATQPKRRINPLTVAAVLLFAVGAGWLLARSTGERGVGDTATGNIDTSRQLIFQCQELAAEGQIVESMQCLDEVLARDPENSEALTYRGWYLVLTSGSTGDQDQSVELLGAGMAYLDQAVEADPDFADARAFRTVIFDRLGQTDLVCEEASTLLALNPPQFFIDQTADIRARNNCS